MFKKTIAILSIICLCSQIINSIIDILKKIEQPRCGTVVCLDIINS